MAESKFAALSPPDKKTFKAFREELFEWDSVTNSNLCVIGGHSKHLYDEPNDLVALRNREQQDGLSQFAEDHLGYFFRVSRKIVSPKTLVSCWYKLTLQPYRKSPNSTP